MSQRDLGGCAHPKRRDIRVDAPVEKNQERKQSRDAHAGQPRLTENSLFRMHMRKPRAGRGNGRQEGGRREDANQWKLACKAAKITQNLALRLPLSRSVTGALVLPGGFVGGVMDAAAEAALKGDGEVQGEVLPP